MKVVELFTGIGSQAKALSKVAEKNSIKIDILRTCEWNIHAILAYHFIHNNSPISNDIKELSKNELVDKLNSYPLSADGKERINSNYLKTLNIDLLQNIYNAIIANN